ncbi:NAD-dependent epimerase/dehydratase family protein [Halobacillus sp. K22]|uniref:NAD-dependent epimerase/dehydratase family protein n=1 Tax=Halobacillus sp. K22 TaxID=3457431 RepID=UPI003FCC9CC5
MKLLVIGGTQFVGKSIVESAIESNHEVTLFNRGKTNPEFFKETEKIIGDRENLDDLKVLQGRRWDAVIDTCGYLPKYVAQAAEVLKEQVDIYVYISSMSVYKHLTEQDQIDEGGEVFTLSDEEIERVTKGVKGRSANEYYGPLKYHSEMAVKEIMKENRSLIIRPGLIVGPDDPTDRFTYWPVRVKAGGSFIVPEPKDKKIQFIDVRDLSKWIVQMIEKQETGVFNTNGPGEKLTMEDFIHSCRTVLNPEATPVWSAESFLLKENVQPWTELPLWVPTQGDFGINCVKAIEKGLGFRAVEETIRDTYEWYRNRREALSKAGLKPAQEKVLLEKLNRL